MIKLTKNQILSWTGGENNFKDYNPEINNVVTDSRKIQENDCYIAIKGENFDGNDFIEQAINNKASVILSNRQSSHKEVITVEDTVIALGNIAKNYLMQFDIKKLAVTGSSGKTTTKDMLYYVFNEHFSTHRTDGNYNNEIGLPLTALNIDKGYEAAIFEMGMSALGEIDYLAQLVRPNIAIITNIGSCHIEILKSQENIFKAKMEISNYLNNDDYLIVNGDDKYLTSLSENEYKFNLIKYGFSGECQLRASDYKAVDGQSEFWVTGMGINRSFTLPAIGLHNVSNALSAIAAGLIYKIPTEKIQAGLMKFQPSKLRMQILEKNNIKYINDSYNANPESMEAVITSFESYARGRRIAVLGDMLELGEFSVAAHERIGRLASEKFDLVFFIGSQMKHAFDNFSTDENTDKRKYHFIDNNIAIEEIKRIIKYGDTILLKGSRGMKLDEIFSALTDDNMEG